MNQDKKTSSFLRAINKYAQQQSDEIKNEVEQFKKQEIEKATKEGISDAYKLIQKEISVKKSQIVSDIAKREQDSRKELFIKRQNIMEAVFADAKEKLLQYTKTEEYNNCIKKSAEQMAEIFENKACVIYLKPADSDKKTLVTDVINNCTVETDDSIKIGGIKGYCEQTSMILDDTFDSKLEDERVWFAENSGLRVV